MNEYQTAHCTVGASLVAACFILGLIITELLRKLAKERETVERLKRLNSKNYHHRKTMERVLGTCCHYIKMDIGVTPRLLNEMTEACSLSKEDHD